MSAGLRVELKAVDGAKMNAVRREVMEEWGKRESELMEGLAEAFERLM